MSGLLIIGLGGTIAAYVLCRFIYRRYPLVWLTPILTSFLLLTLLIELLHIRYQTYSEGAQWLTNMLQPATVAFAVPLYRHFDILRRHAAAILISLLAGAATGIVASTSLAIALRLGTRTALTLAPRSVTTPIAMDISREIGGIPDLTAVCVIFTGITGALIGPVLIRRLRIQGTVAQGSLFGMGAHGIGTAKAFELSPEIGATSSLAMVLGACLTLILAPWLAPWLVHHL